MTSPTIVFNFTFNTCCAAPSFYAGGEKYKVRGILFKFARDAEVRPGFWLYGGSAGAMDELAGKAAAHELRSSVKFFEFGLLEQVGDQYSCRVLEQRCRI